MLIQCSYWQVRTTAGKMEEIEQELMASGGIIEADNKK